MRKMLPFMLLVLCVFSLFGCGSVTSKKQNAMEISEDGKITASSYGSFDRDYYDAAELKKQVEAAIDEYNSSIGEKRIELKKCSRVKENIQIIISYASGEDYTAFNGVSCYMGTLESAVSEGLVDTSERITNSDGNLKTTIGELNAKNGSDISILIIEEPMAVDVPGTVQYIGEDVQISGKGICITGAGSTGDIVLDHPCCILYTKKK